jgi:hypothetical protein
VLLEKVAGTLGSALVALSSAHDDDDDADECWSAITRCFSFVPLTSLLLSFKKHPKYWKRSGKSLPSYWTKAFVMNGNYLKASCLASLLLTSYRLPD